MITLNISSNIKYSNLEDDIYQIFVAENIECQLIKTKSVVKYDKKSKIETGFILKIFNLEPIKFKEFIWTKLKKLMNLTCAFIQYNNEYMGCILNWPGVFTNNNCHSCNKQNNILIIKSEKQVRTE